MSKLDGFKAALQAISSEFGFAFAAADDPMPIIKAVHACALVGQSTDTTDPFSGVIFAAVLSWLYPEWWGLIAKPLAESLGPVARTDFEGLCARIGKLQADIDASVLTDDGGGGGGGGVSGGGSS